MNSRSDDSSSAPTWYGSIRALFTDVDIQHMANQGLDLTSYEQVRASAGTIYGQVSVGSMPPGNPWSQGKLDSFLAWMSSGYPKGSPSITRRELAIEMTASRVRKDVDTLTAEETELLKTAFSAIMLMGTDDPNSYFVQAGYHWLPAPLYCQHHVPGYNPWHRAYLISFENALRSVPGCESVTLPYWDIAKPFPELLKSDPFASYTLPVDIGQGFKKGYQTSRNTDSDIEQLLKEYDVVADIGRAMTKTDWSDFHGVWAGAENNTIISAHDGGHGAIGPTLANQSVASYDPAFWFFHANWDRLWWEWQKAMQATTLNGLLSTIDQEADPLSYQIFTVPPLQAIEPFTSLPLGLDAVKVVDSAGSLGVDYAAPAAPLLFDFQPKSRHSVPIDRKISIDSERATVRVDGINRLKIPGSFKVHIFRNGQRLASRFFFQPNEAESCETCIKNPIAHFDFDVPLLDIAGNVLAVEVEPLDTDFVGDRFPVRLMGQPSISVHIPAKTE